MLTPPMITKRAIFTRMERTTPFICYDKDFVINAHTLTTYTSPSLFSFFYFYFFFIGCRNQHCAAFPIIIIIIMLK